MCTAVILRRPDHPWPLIFAGNRDEMAARPWSPPGAHWPELPGVLAGLDRLSGGSWVGLGPHGVMAAALNRYGTLGPKDGKASRGELVLDALEQPTAAAAVKHLATRDPARYRSFNLVLADAREAFWLRHTGAPGVEIETRTIPEGLHLISAHDMDDIDSSPRLRRYLPRFQEASPPDPGREDWRAWQDLLSDRATEAGEEATTAMCFETDWGFATLSSTLIALPAAGLGERPRFLFAAGAPCRTPYRPVLA